MGTLGGNENACHCTVKSESILYILNTEETFGITYLHIWCLLTSQAITQHSDKSFLFDLFLLNGWGRAKRIQFFQHVF